MCVSRSTLATYCGRDSSVALDGGLRNQWTLTHPCCASHTRFGASSAAATTTASASPNNRSTSRRQTAKPATSRTRTTARVYFVSRPIPAATPRKSHEPRPSASRNASQRTTIVVSWSNETGWKRPFVATRSGENPTATAARVCARRPPPSSRATSAATITVVAPAAIANDLKPTSDQPNRIRAAAERRPVTAGNST
jgi:hypothetical protein